MLVVNIHEAKTNLSSLLTKIEKTGKEVLICRYGKPVADLVPHKCKNRLQPHSVMSKIKIDYDPTEPLSKDEWAGGTLDETII
ncbi:MAG: type II toxin-antitoxin system Phd/YefM family antitoxin [Deltaproteobacteria bacterium]|nr:type II toxin-antitoxin system Phd/YefM family antitoxin [Candidatus Tharpella aukensis]